MKISAMHVYFYFCGALVYLFSASREIIVSIEISLILQEHHPTTSVPLIAVVIQHSLALFLVCVTSCMLTLCFWATTWWILVVVGDATLLIATLDMGWSTYPFSSSTEDSLLVSNTHYEGMPFLFLNRWLSFGFQNTLYLVSNFIVWRLSPLF